MRPTLEPYFVCLLQEAHGHALIPPDYANAHDVGWVEAGRWIARNAKLFSKGKLTDKRYQLIRDILGARPPASCCGLSADTCVP